MVCDPRGASLGTVREAVSEVALLERDRELGLIERWLSEAREGHGRVVVVRGSAGLGKTALLDCGVQVAAKSGVRVLSARGSELERDMSFGVARQLFENLLRRVSDADRRAILAGPAALTQALLGLAETPPSGGDPLGVIHGLYWLTANMSDVAPLLLAVDDLHWADAQSLRWLAYLAPRMADLSVLVLATAREEEADSDPLMSAVSNSTHASALSLQPLRAEGVAELVRAHFGRAADPEFVDACQRACGGNPFFAIELLRAAAADAIEPTSDHAAAVHRLGPQEVARSILVRLAGLGETARVLANAVAILGTDAELRHCGQLSGLTIEQVLAAWDALARAAILQPGQPLQFIHPIARTAVYRELPPGERTRAHRAAASILDDDGAEPQRIAVHALACEPAGDPAVVQWLRDAARRALGSGAPDAAAQYLRRALEEPPAPDERPQLHFELGQALSAVDIAAAAASLGWAASTAVDSSLQLLAYRWAGYALAYGGRIAEAIAAFDRAVELAGDTDVALLLSATRDGFAVYWPDDPNRSARRARLEQWARAPAPVTTGQRRALAAAAMNICLTGSDSAARAIELADRAASGELSFTDQRDGEETTSAIATVRHFCDDPRPSLWRTLRPQVASDGLVLKSAFMHGACAQVSYRHGALLDAEADARTAWDVFAPFSEDPTIMYWWVLTPLIQVLIARGLLDETEALVAATGLRDASIDAIIVPWPPVLRAELALARGRLAEAVEVLLESGDRLERHGFANPAVVPWRALAAPALAALGRRDDALGVLGPALTRAREFGAPWALGMTLRAAGTIEQSESGIALLQEAVEVLERSPCRLEHAHALVELGAALRHSNRRADARGHLRSALDMAHRCGATPVAIRAEQELAATGARPRRVLLFGVEALTASERRVAELAVSGLSNPEIAQQLFVTRKTVETHLGHVYAKLNIASRNELADALAD